MGSSNFVGPSKSAGLPSIEVYIEDDVEAKGQLQVLTRVQIPAISRSNQGCVMSEGIYKWCRLLLLVSNELDGRFLQHNLWIQKEIRSKKCRETASCIFEVESSIK